MTKILRETVLQLAKQSALRLTDEEVDQFTDDLNNLENSLASMQVIDTAGVEPTYQVSKVKNIWRQDEVDQTQVDPETLVAYAADSQQDSIKVPKVL